MTAPNLAKLSLVVSVLIGVGVLPSQAFTIKGLKDGGPNKTIELSPKKDYKVSLTTLPAKHLDDPTEDGFALLRQTFPTWKFTNGDNAPGSVNVLQYDAFALKTLGGSNFSVLYDDGDEKSRTDYSWVQIGRPDDWGSTDSKIFVDNSFSNFPFYGNYTPIGLPNLMTPTSFYDGAIWLDSANYPQQKIQNPTGGSKVPQGDLLFVDQPFCTYSCTDKDGKSSLDLDLFLVSFIWNGKGGNEAAGEVTMYDGLRYGVQIERVPAPPGVPAPPALLGLPVVFSYTRGIRRLLRGHR
jgi:hypothetical protein